MPATNVITSTDYRIEYSPNGSSGWVDWSGFIDQITPTGGDVATVLWRPLDANVPEIFHGKTGVMQATLKVGYTETDTEPIDLLRAAQTGRTNIYLRISPRGGQSGEQQFTTSAVFVKSGAAHPPAVTGEGDAILTNDVVCEFKSYTVSTTA